MRALLNDKEISVSPGTTILQACLQNNIEVPHFCYHPHLSAAGNCRMCLVEVKDIQKPVASCMMPVADGMQISTCSEKVKKNREAVLEFILIHHPLDCPICDQGGECNLQNYAYLHGKAFSRYDFDKRAVTDKDMGPFIKTAMTRCIHCTRCVRFADEITGLTELGGLGRGENLEIVSCLEQAIESELSGNMIDLCPVGALLSKPSAFAWRSWELARTPTIDVMDALGAKIDVYHRNGKIMRVLPRALKSSLDQGSWINDKTRFSYDGNNYQRLNQACERIDDKLQPCSLDKALYLVAEKLRTTLPEAIASLSGELTDVESFFLFKKIQNFLGSTAHECRFDGADVPYHARSSYLFNTTIEGIDTIDALLLIGTNPRVEAPILNAHIRKRYLALQKKIPIGLFFQQEESLNLGYTYENLGETVFDLLTPDKSPKTAIFFEKMKEAHNPCVIIGAHAFRCIKEEHLTSLSLFFPHATFNVLHHSASYVGGLDAGFVQPLRPHHFIEKIEKGEFKLVYLLGNDRVSIDRGHGSFVVYQGHHGDKGASQADIVLPTLSYLEKSATYVTLEGSYQKTTKVINGPESVLDDAMLLRRLANLLELTSLSDKIMHDCIFHERKVPKREEKEVEVTEQPQKRILKPYIQNFYMTNVIAKHSVNMANALREKLGRI